MDTNTRGGEISGNCDTGRLRIANTPTNTNSTDMTMARTGR